MNRLLRFSVGCALCNTKITLFSSKHEIPDQMSDHASETFGRITVSVIDQLMTGQRLIDLSIVIKLDLSFRKSINHRGVVTRTTNK